MKTKGRTARYSWREFFAGTASIGCYLLEADRDALPFAAQRLVDDVASDETVGGLLAWNRTRDEDVGHLVMLTGQTAGQQLQVMRNARWLVSCGATYAAARVGRRSEGSATWRIRHAGDTWLVWALPNDRDVEGMVR